ncbi:MAG: protein translocase subunit SecF [Proteobacteria bacterium]|nr:protein translocase subunit SecF [Pseudomonadota bacterium]
MKLIRLAPPETQIPFLSFRFFAFALSGVLAVASVVLLMISGLNFGIDFRGGILIEVRTAEAADISVMRDAVSGLGLGDVGLQEFGEPRDVLIRIAQQPGGEEAQLAAADLVKEALAGRVGEVEYRRVEFVGPKVSAELIRDGLLALALALGAMMIYIWLRFEWQFGLGAVIALAHDVLVTMGVFSLLQLEFNLSIIAAILTIIGYSMNDTVVVYDRVRENLIKHRTMPLIDLLNRSKNETLSRTLMTSVTTLLALLALFFFGGAVIKGFTFAMIWGVVVGTYSSIFVAGPLLLYFGIDRLAASKGGSATQDSA